MNMRMEMITKQSARQLIVAALTDKRPISRSDAFKGAFNRSKSITRNALRKAWAKMEADGTLSLVDGTDVPGEEKLYTFNVQPTPSGDPPPHDAATATGMYDHDDGV